MSVLVVEELRVSRGGTMVIDGVTFAVAPGELVAVMGASGAGKTTLLRAIAGLEPIVGGAVTIGGARLAAGRPPAPAFLREQRRRVGMVFQFHHLFAHLSALHNVWLAPVHVLREPREAAERRARELLETLGVASRADALPHELSGGEAQRVAIARALAVDPRVLLMDEPTASLDPGRRGELASTLRQLSVEGRTVVVATHDSEFARACADRVVVIDQGRVTREGAAADVLAAAT